MENENTGSIEHVPVRPQFVAVVSIAIAAWGVLSLVFPAAILFSFSSVWRDSAFLLIPSLFFGVALIALARGVWRLCPWSRTLLEGVSWIGLFGFPVGTLFFSGLLIYFRRPQIKALFSRASQEGVAPIAIEYRAGRLVLALCSLGIVVGILGILSVIALVIVNT